MSFDNKLDSILTKHGQIADKLQNPGGLNSKDFGRLSKEYSDMSTVVEFINQYRQAQQTLVDSEELMKDPEMKALAEEEYFEAKKMVPELEHKIKLALIPKDEADDLNVILELRAGTGGEEAALFAGDLLEMYQRYAQRKGWKFEIMELYHSDTGGYREAICNISGNSVYSRMKFESGVHRVQRVPTTETQGRVHTSAATVAVLPEAEEVDIKIEEKDLRIDVYRSSGPGGQSVNTTDSAVRITHVPTNTVVACQDEKSQHKNKAKAMKILKSRIYENIRMQQDMERAKNRKSQVGTGDRSERIRTYNFPQSRVTDHRINLTTYNIDAVVGTGDLDAFIEALIADDQARKLLEGIEE